MENSSGSNISDILKEEGNSECVDCGAAEVKWISLNNGVFLCDKCAEIHRTFGMSVSQILSLQLPTWSEDQLLYLKKGGNKNYKKNLTEYNIAPSASLDVKYKSKAASYYRRYLKNEVDKESDPKYVETTIIKPDLKDAEQIEEVIEEVPKEEKKEEEQTPTNKVVGFMANLFNKIKEGTIVAAKTVETPIMPNANPHAPSSITESDLPSKANASSSVSFEARELVILGNITVPIAVIKAIGTVHIFCAYSK